VLRQAGSLPAVSLPHSCSVLPTGYAIFKITTVMVHYFTVAILYHFIMS